MRVPLIWLKDYIDTKKTPKEIAESFTALGLMLDKPIEKDVLDLEHRMDRSDWLSIIGCARDFAAMEGLKFKFPELNKTAGKQPKKSQIIDIKIECPDLVHRFNTRVFRGIKVKKSPKWLSERLEAYGIPSINNIVDITNFVMVELGQPMHAQDIAKMEKPEIVIRRAKDNEEITTLLGQQIKLNSKNFVLTQNNKPTVIGGIVGTKSTSVDENTADIVLDAGNYDQVNIRKSSRELKIQNETVLRYDKFLHPKLTEIALERATKLILELAGGEYYQNIDYYPKSFPLKKLKLRFSRIKQISGMNIPESKIEMILDSLGYSVLNKNSEGMSLDVPYFRTDVEVEDDIVSDILRINNYKNIPSDVLNMAPPAEITPKIYVFEERLRDILVNLGLYEHITNPLVISDESKKDQVKEQISKRLYFLF
jgi:phenylalanyl-tRNA synthetase beta chain